MGIPLKIAPNSLADYLSVMTKAIFQAGVSWALIDSRWPAFEQSFENFDPHRVADFDDAKVQELVENPRLFKSESKIRATIENAKTMLSLDKEYGSFKDYLRSFSSYETLSRDLRKRFAYLGELSVYYFLFRNGEAVPDFESWVATIKGHHPRMREMVQLSQGKLTTDKPGDALNAVRGQGQAKDRNGN